MKTPDAFFTETANSLASMSVADNIDDARENHLLFGVNVAIISDDLTFNELFRNVQLVLTNLATITGSDEVTAHYDLNRSHSISGVYSDNFGNDKFGKLEFVDATGVKASDSPFVKISDFNFGVDFDQLQLEKKKSKSVEDEKVPEDQYTDSTDKDIIPEINKNNPRSLGNLQCILDGLSEKSNEDELEL